MGTRKFKMYGVRPRPKTYVTVRRTGHGQLCYLRSMYPIKTVSFEQLFTGDCTRLSFMTVLRLMICFCTVFLTTKPCRAVDRCKSDELPQHCCVRARKQGGHASEDCRVGQCAHGSRPEIVQEHSAYMEHSGHWARRQLPSNLPYPRHHPSAYWSRVHYQRSL